MSFGRDTSAVRREIPSYDRRWRTFGAFALILVTMLCGTSAAHAAEPLPPFAITSFDGGFATADGTPYTQAGGHPFNASGGVKFNYHLSPFEEARPNADPKDFQIELPPGLVGNPLAATRCTQVEFGPGGTGGAHCPVDSQVGVSTVNLLYGFPEPSVAESAIYNLVPPPGVAAEFGFHAAVTVNARLDASVGPGPDFPILLSVRNASQAVGLTGARLDLWGVPADSRHDPQRRCQQDDQQFCKGQGALRSFVTLPTSCTGPQATKIRVNTWEEQDHFLEASFFNHDDSTPPNPLGQEGCSMLDFSPTASVQPTSHQADSPTGLNFSLKIPQNESPQGLAEAHLKDAVVSLPEGMTVNPSSATGLGACSSAQIGLETTAPAGCPDNSKLGTVEVKTPLIDHPLGGSVYLAQQGQNKFGSLLAIYLAIEDPDSGVVIKLPGLIETSPSGRLLARVDGSPQLPFEELKVQFFGGARASLRTPEACGTYSIQTTLTPWSGTEPVGLSSAFQITEGPNGAPCPNGAFAPRLEAGTTNPSAGKYSPFVLRLSRSDGTQQLDHFAVTLPQGLLAKLAGVPYCPDAALSGVSGAEGSGAAQLVSPACPAASQVGTVSVGAGAGPSPFYLDTGRVYLAGPYRGAPLSFAVVTPALAGPFDLGSVVVRTALYVDTNTARVTAATDPLPTILHGIPLDLRDVRVAIDRDQFTLNPTSCDQMKFSGSAFGTAGAEAPLAQRFQVGNCRSLAFKPRLALSLHGPTGRSKNPALKAVLTQSPGEAALKRAAVVLPKSEFIDNRHINNPCTRAQFNAGPGNGTECPAKSILGFAEASTPLLAQPLKGPVYFRSNGGERELPDLVASLDGQLHVNLVGFIDSVDTKGSEISRVRTTFATVPDAPVSRFVLRLKGGKKGLLQNSANLCKVRNLAVVKMLGQNGGRRDFSPEIANDCKRKPTRHPGKPR